MGCRQGGECKDREAGERAACRPCRVGRHHGISTGGENEMNKEGRRERERTEEKEEKGRRGRG